MVKLAQTPPTTAAKKKKKTRPLLSSSPPSSNLKNGNIISEPINSKTPNSLFTDSAIRRSARSKPILEGVWSALEDNEDEDEDERDMKKQKLV
ncbi:unnamed protein product [Rhodiola kirilowii]